MISGFRVQALDFRFLFQVLISGLDVRFYIPGFDSGRVFRIRSQVLDFGIYNSGSRFQVFRFQVSASGCVFRFGFHVYIPGFRFGGLDFRFWISGFYIPSFRFQILRFQVLYFRL